MFSKVQCKLKFAQAGIECVYVYIQEIPVEIQSVESDCPAAFVTTQQRFPPSSSDRTFISARNNLA